MARLSIARLLQAPRVISSALVLLSAMFVTPGYAAPDERVQALARAEAAPLLTTLKDLVAIESGSGDREGLDRISALIHQRLTALGGKTEFIEPGADTHVTRLSP